MKKITFTLTAILFGIICQAQQLPTEQISLADFGLPDSLLQYSTAYYKADSFGYEPKMLLVRQFNDQGKLEIDYMEIFGPYASTTTKQYVYKNGLIDSLNYTASNENFSSKSKYYYNEAMQLSHIVSTGYYANYTDKFTYNSQGKLSKKVRLFDDKESFNEEYFYDDKNQFEYVKRIENGMPTTYTYYIDKEKFATYTDEDNYVTFTTELGDITAPIDDELDEMVSEMRQAKLNNPENYNGEIEDVIENGTYEFVIPANTNAESGELVKQYEINYAFKPEQRRYLFHHYYYKNKTEVGSTQFDHFFQSNIERRQLHTLNWNDTSN